MNLSSPASRPVANRPGPLFVAIDTQDTARAQALIAAVAPVAGGVKIGLEFFSVHGPAGIRQVLPQGTPLFLDLKFHDIPNTVAGAVRSALALRPAFLTLHAAGGVAMMQAAVEAATGSGCRILAVTVLTSLDESDLTAVGQTGPVRDQVRRLASLARESGVDGIVCAPHEVAAVRADSGPGFTLMVPGIRPAWAAAGDQKRVMAPGEVLAAGADHIVVGRPITGAADPAAAARRILDEIPA